MSIDFDSTGGRKQYLSDKLDDMLDGINESYGTLLVDELINRLELTIKDFNAEMKVLCEQLVKKEKERQHLLGMLKSGDATDDRTKLTSDSEPPGSDGETEDEDLPEWERKLAKLEQK